MATCRFDCRTSRWRFWWVCLWVVYIGFDCQSVIQEHIQSHRVLCQSPPDDYLAVGIVPDNSVREYVFYVLSDFRKHDFLRFFWNAASKKRKSHKKYQVCWTFIEILASKRIDIYHTVLSCIVSCVHTSEQDVWCWWPWLTGTDFR